MKIVVLKCPHCGANLEIENGIDICFCNYCSYKIILDGQSKESIKARVRMKQMEHDAIQKNKDLTHERYKIEMDKKTKKFSAIQTNISSLVMVALISIFFFSLHLKSEQQEKNLQKIVDTVEIDIANGNYDSALINANSLYYDADWSSEIKSKWDNVRLSLIETIESKTKSIVPESSKNLEGINYQEVIIMLKAAGFTNITATALTDLVNGWFTKDGDVEKVSISGMSDFKVGDSFSKDSEITIIYHTFPQKDLH